MFLEMAANVQDELQLTSLLAFTGVAASVLLALPIAIALPKRFGKHGGYIALSLCFTAALYLLGTSCILLQIGLLPSSETLARAAYILVTLATFLLTTVGILFGFLIPMEFKNLRDFGSKNLPKE